MITTDIIILVFLGIMAYKGHQQGFVVSILHILVILAALFLAATYTPELSLYLQDYLNLLDDSIINIISFILLFIVITAVFNFLVNFFQFINKVPLIGSLNKWLGAFFGLLKGALIVSIFLALMNEYLFDDPNEVPFEKGDVYVFFESFDPILKDTFETLKESGESLYDDINEPSQDIQTNSSI